MVANGMPLMVAKSGLHPKKVLMFIWWDWKSINYYEMLPQGEINSVKYCSQLDKLKETIAIKRSELTNRRGVVFQPGPMSSTVRNKLLSFDWDVLPHYPYSPDIAPCDYYLFLSLKNSLRGKKFNTINDLKMHLERYFVSKPQKFWKDGIIRLPERWRKVIEQNGS